MLPMVGVVTTQALVPVLPSVEMIDPGPPMIPPLIPPHGPLPPEPDPEPEPEPDP